MINSFLREHDHDVCMSSDELNARMFGQGTFTPDTDKRRKTVELLLGCLESSVESHSNIRRMNGRKNGGSTVVASESGKIRIELGILEGCGVDVTELRDRLNLVTEIR
jgi:hypothetical protein